METNKYVAVSIVFFILFLGTLIFSISVIAKNDKSGGGEDSQSEVEKLNAALTKLNEEKQELEKEKSTLKGKLKEQQQDKPVFGVDKDSPFDHVKDSQVRVLKNKVEIDMKDVM
tara:strand:+ start:914 stop:1255 length:342 start_codon:yes stop_codon:yes gene_type:complete